MRNTRLALPLWIGVAFFQLGAPAPVANAASDSPIKTIMLPDGGKVVYGEVPGQATESGAMAFVLRSIHQQYGNEPEVSQAFRVRGSDSIAAFYSVEANGQGSGRRTGLIIAARTPDHVEAGVISDDAAHFPASYQAMMKTLFQAWHPFQVPQGAGGAEDADNAGPAQASAPVAAIPQMRQYVTRDQSVAINLPDGWEVNPTISSMGSLVASGPNGEAVGLGIGILAGDTRNPFIQQTLRALQQGGLRNTAYARGFYYPWNADLAKLFVDSTQFNRARHGLPPAAFQIESETPINGGGGQRCAHITGYVNAQDGKGNRELNVVFSESYPNRTGGYLTDAYFTTVPVAVADAERPMMGAIMASYSINENVVQRESGAIAAPAIAAIHEIGRRAAAQAAAAHRAEDIHNAAVEAHWDSIDRQSKSFSDYLLDNTVIQDNAGNTHGTYSNQDAQALIQSDPNRFEAVPNTGLRKGVDY